ncbi:hypothetical protein [Arthrobacter sp. OY3WO11]|uniref:hypothetical protein n=1 Tax=Arthrobacter sp. OY3WO11 TaxID=1835723 RepID=UPI0007CF1DE9|nr:hypothetical protein [Arthrobacter sp. OY3WO11]OAE02463.1 hypothetical protein A6A22_14285 [Arthrobacter sp. OY3WO11]
MSHLRFLTPVAVAGLLFATAGTAVAAPPEHFGPFEQLGSGIAVCDDFDALVVVNESTRYTLFRDEAGDVKSFKQHVSAPANTWINLTTGKTIVVRAHFVQTWDAKSGNLTVVGFRHLVNEQGDGVTVQDVGRIVYADQTQEEILSMAGQHDISNWGLISPALCDALE